MLLFVLSSLLSGGAPVLSADDGLVVGTTANSDQRRGVSEFARCVVRKDSKRSDALVRSDPNTRAEEDAFAGLTHTIHGCSHSAAATGYLPGRAIFRGAVGEQLWLKDVRTFHGIGVAESSSRQVDLSTRFNVTPWLGERYDVARCAVYHGPGAVDQLVRTHPASVQENAAFAALVPQLRSCAVEGHQLSLDRTLMRGLLAEQLYRQYRQPAPPTPSSILLDPPH